MKKDNLLKIAFAGDRDISVEVLKYLLEQGIKPLALMVSDEKQNASHDKELIALISDLNNCHIFRGNEFRSKENIGLLKSLNLDYILSVHFHYIFPKECLEILKEGALNLHPAFLPCNRGWHTPSWAILDGTPYGATLHFIDENTDSGDIVGQKEIKISEDDTADTLYKKVKDLELEVFKETWPKIVSKTYTKIPQELDKGTFYERKDLSQKQFIDLDKDIKAGDLINQLRALTTNKIGESAYFEKDGKKYHIQVSIKKHE